MASQNDFTWQGPGYLECGPPVMLSSKRYNVTLSAKKRFDVFECELRVCQRLRKSCMSLALCAQNHKTYAAGFSESVDAGGFPVPHGWSL